MRNGSPPSLPLKTTGTKKHVPFTGGINCVSRSTRRPPPASATALEAGAARHRHPHISLPFSPLPPSLAAPAHFPPESCSCGRRRAGGGEAEEGRVRRSRRLRSANGGDFGAGGKVGWGKMNAFRLAGDMTHLLSIILLLLKIRNMKSCAGISLKTQELYVLVFVTRYLDIFTTYVSFYNSIMKIIFLGTSMTIVWYMRYHKVVKQTYSKEEDTFRHFFLALPCFILALLINREFTVTEVLWAFSIYLESVAILPQLVLLQRSRNIDNLTGNYVFLLGAYRALYLINWIYRFFTEKHHVRWIPWLSGLLQTALYTDFFYYYLKSWKNREKLKLPA